MQSEPLDRTAFLSMAGEIAKLAGRSPEDVKRMQGFSFNAKDENPQLEVTWLVPSPVGLMPNTYTERYSISSK